MATFHIRTVSCYKKEAFVAQIAAHNQPIILFQSGVLSLTIDSIIDISTFKQAKIIKIIPTVFIIIILQQLTQHKINAGIVPNCYCFLLSNS